MIETAIKVAKQEDIRLRRLRGEQIAVEDAPPPKLKPHYMPHVGLNAVLQGRATGIFPRNVDEIVEVDDDLQADIDLWNNLIDYVLRGNALLKPG